MHAPGNALSTPHARCPNRHKRPATLAQHKSMATSWCIGARQCAGRTAHLRGRVPALLQGSRLCRERGRLLAAHPECRRHVQVHAAHVPQAAPLLLHNPRKPSHSLPSAALLKAATFHQSNLAKPANLWPTPHIGQFRPVSHASGRAQTLPASAGAASSVAKDVLLLVACSPKALLG